MATDGILLVIYALSLASLNARYITRRAWKLNVEISFNLLSHVRPATRTIFSSIIEFHLSKKTLLVENRNWCQKEMLRDLMPPICKVNLFARFNSIRSSARERRNFANKFIIGHQASFARDRRPRGTFPSVSKCRFNCCWSPAINLPRPVFTPVFFWIIVFL